MMNFITIGYGPSNLRLGPTISSSNPSTSTSSAQTTVQGAAGANSPTLTAANNINYSYNDPALQLGTVQALASTIQTALGGAGNLAAQSLTTAANSAATQSADQAQILSNALAAEQSLSAYQGTNGGLQQSQTTNYALYGAIGIGALALLAILFRPSRA
jgi:hypothetical protein